MGIKPKRRGHVCSGVAFSNLVAHQASLVFGRLWLIGFVALS